MNFTPQTDLPSGIIIRGWQSGSGLCWRATTIPIQKNSPRNNQPEIGGAAGDFAAQRYNGAGFNAGNIVGAGIGGAVGGAVGGTVGRAAIAVGAGEAETALVGNMAGSNIGTPIATLAQALTRSLLGKLFPQPS